MMSLPGVTVAQRAECLLDVSGSAPPTRLFVRVRFMNLKQEVSSGPDYFLLVPQTSCLF